jgi:hypothetical protein
MLAVVTESIEMLFSKGQATPASYALVISHLIFAGQAAPFFKDKRVFTTFRANLSLIC